jgi:hypothetical protein
VLRHGLAALVLFALLIPLIPAAEEAMTCCLGTGESCVCPLTPGFARCEVRPSLTSLRALPAILPPAPLPFALGVSLELLPSPVEELASLPLPPLVPPPRS